MATNSTSALAKVLMVASLGLAAVAAAVAIVQPGDLGNGGTATTDDVAATDDDPATDDDGVGTDDQAADDAPPVTADDDIALPADDDTTTTTTIAAAPTTTTPDSGLIADGTAEPRDSTDALADTGIESMLGLAALLGAAGWLLGRRRS